MMKKKTLMFLALSVLVAMTGVMVNAWAIGNYEGELDNATIWDGELQYKVTSLNPNTNPMEATVTVVANKLPRATTTAINIPDNFTKYVKGTYAEQNIEGDVKFTINAIGKNAFADLPEVKSMTIPAGIESIGDDGFNNMGNLKTLTFAPGSKLKTIGDYTFGISNISEIDFSNCADLDLCGTVPFMPRGGENPVNMQLKKVILPTGMKCIGQAFANCPNLAEIVNLENTAIENIPEGAFEGDAALTSLTLPALTPGKTMTIGPNAFCGTNITELTINADLTTGSLTPASFAGIQLQTLTINGKLLGAATIPAGVFAEKCDDKCSKGSLKNLYFNGKIVGENAIATGAVTGLTALENLTFANINANGIAEGAFQGNVNSAANKAATITFNGALGANAIGTEAFKGSDFTKITFVQDLDFAAIGTGAFADTKKDLSLPAVVEFQGLLSAAGAVGTEAFKGSDVTKVEFKQAILKAGAIAESAFEDADALNEILFDASLNETGVVAASAFKNAGNNAKLYVENIMATKAIDGSAFEGASIKFATFNSLNATEAIAPNQFKSVVALAELTINGDLKNENIIGASAFDGTENLGKILITGDIKVADAIKGEAGSEPFNGAGAKKPTTLSFTGDEIVAGGIGAYAFAESGINTIELKNSASNFAQEAFVANSFLNIPKKALIKYNPAQSNIKGHSFNQEAFAPAYQEVDIKFQTNAFVKRAYEIAEGNNDLTPWRIKFMLNIELTMETQGADGNYYTVWAPQDEMYIIDKYQENGATIKVYSAYFDDLSFNEATIGDDTHPEDNVMYFNPLRLQADGKYVLNADEALLIQSTKPFTDANPLQARQNIKENSMDPEYQFGGIQTFAGLNVRQCNDFRYSPWQIYSAAYYNNQYDNYGNKLNDYEIFRLHTPETMPYIYNATWIPANGLYVLGAPLGENQLALREKYSGKWEESWIAKYQANEALKAAVIATLEMTGEPTNQQIIDELVKQIANKDLDPTLEATLNGIIEGLRNLNNGHEKLLVDLIKAEKQVSDAKEALKDAIENGAEDVDDTALTQAEQDMADAVADMNKFTLGVIYLAADRAYDKMEKYYKAKERFDKALADWQKEHAEYLAQVNAIEETEDVDYIPVKVLTNVDADGKEIEGYVGKKFYLKATPEILAILNPEAEEEVDGGARRAVEEEPAAETKMRVELYVKDEKEQEPTTEPTDPEENQQGEQNSEQQSEPILNGVRLAPAEVVESPSFTATGIFVEFDQVEGYDYTFTSYGDQPDKSYFSTLVPDNKVEAVGKEFERYSVDVAEEAVGDEPAKTKTIILFKETAEDGTETWWTVTTNEDKQEIPVEEYTGDTSNAVPCYTTLCEPAEQVAFTIPFKANADAELDPAKQVLWDNETDKNQFIQYGTIVESYNSQEAETQVVVDPETTKVQWTALCEGTPRKWTIFYYEDDYYATYNDGETFYTMADPVLAMSQGNEGNPYLFWTTPGAQVLDEELVASINNDGSKVNKSVISAGNSFQVLTDGTDYYFTDGPGVYRILATTNEGGAENEEVLFTGDNAEEAKADFINSLIHAYETYDQTMYDEYYLWIDEDENIYGKKVISGPEEELELGTEYYHIYKTDVTETGWNWSLGEIETSSLENISEYWKTVTKNEVEYNVVTINGMQGQYILFGDALVPFAALAESEGVWSIVTDYEPTLATGNEIAAYTQDEDLCYLKNVSTEDEGIVWTLKVPLTAPEGARRFDDQQQGGDDQQQGGDDQQQGGDDQQQGGDDQQQGGDDQQQGGDEEPVVGVETKYFANEPVEGKDRPGEEIFDYDVPVDPVQLATGTVALVKENGAVVYETANNQNFYAIQVVSNTEEGFDNAIFYVVADEDMLADGAEGLKVYAKNDGEDASVNPFVYTGMTVDVAPAGDFTFTSYPDMTTADAWATGRVELVVDGEGEPAIETAQEGTGNFIYTPKDNDYDALAAATEELDDAAEELKEAAAAIKGLETYDAEERQELVDAKTDAETAETLAAGRLSDAQRAYNQLYQQALEAFRAEADGTNFNEWITTSALHSALVFAQTAVDLAQAALDRATEAREAAEKELDQYDQTGLNTATLADLRDEIAAAIIANDHWDVPEDSPYYALRLLVDADGQFVPTTVEADALAAYIAAKAAVKAAEEALDAAQETADQALINKCKQDLKDAIDAFDAAMKAIHDDDTAHAHVANADARKINVVFNDGNDPVGIMEAVVANGSKAVAGEGAIYNLQGIRVNKASKGVFIQNGVKVIK